MAQVEKQQEPAEVVDEKPTAAEEPIGFAEVIRALQSEADMLRRFGTATGLRRALAFERGADVVARVRDETQHKKIRDQFRWK